MKKLIIREEDGGYGEIYYNGHRMRYSCEDDGADMLVAVKNLIAIGFICAEDVELFDFNTSLPEIYDRLSKVRQRI